MSENTTPTQTVPLLKLYPLSGMSKGDLHSVLDTFLIKPDASGSLPLPDALFVALMCELKTRMLLRDQGAFLAYFVPRTPILRGLTKDGKLDLENPARLTILNDNLAILSLTSEDKHDPDASCFDILTGKNVSIATATTRQIVTLQVVFLSRMVTVINDALLGLNSMESAPPAEGQETGK